MNYILEVSICWLGFYLLYLLFLSKETFFRINRVYLLSTLLLGLLIPLFDFPLSSAVMEQDFVVFLEPITVGVQNFEHSLEEIVVVGGGEERDYSWILTLLYLLGMIVFASRLVFGFWQIERMRRRGRQQWKEGYKVVKTQSHHLPFSFFNTLYMSQKVDLEQKDEAKILAHELAHIQGRHSYDILFVEILGILMWCSPLIFLYKRSLRNVHEYLADAEVLQNTKKKQYGQLLLRQFQSGYSIALANNFNHSQLKKRFDMMMKNKSPRRALIKYLPLLPLAAVLLLAFATEPDAGKGQWEQLRASISTQDFDPEKIKQQVNTLVADYQNASVELDERKKAKQRLLKACMLLADQHPQHRRELVQIVDQIIQKTNIPFVIQLTDGDRILFMEDGASKGASGAQGEVFQVVEKMPKFPGCEPNEGEIDYKKCADQKMLEFVYQNIKYPKKARENGIEGIVVVRFIVDTEGNVVKPEIVRSIGGGCDEAVLDIVKQMPKWIPGEQNGEKVDVYFNLPVRFKLAGQERATNPASTEKAEQAPARGSESVGDMEIFKLAEQMPQIKGCENIAEKEDRQLCAQKKLLEYIYLNIKYPKKARENGIEGIVVAQFVVTKAGEIQSPKIIRSIGGGCDEEVLRVVNSMEEAWWPGQQNGKAVNVMMNIPVRFKLKGESETKSETREEPQSTTQSTSLQLEVFTAFPNPTSDQLTIRFAGPEGPTQLKVYDVAGKMALNSEIQLDGLFEQTIDLSNLAKGTVFITVTQGDRVFVEKVIYQ
ncbi:MAG: TonB family protein [Bacteroidota bacterium]